VTPCPKPVKREKKKPRGLRAKRWGVRRKAGGTAHSRRPREWGRMVWLHSLRMCFVWGFFATHYQLEVADEKGAAMIQWRLIGRVPACGGPFQCAHLFGRYNNGDDKTILACRDHHMDIDQTRRWFLVLAKPERLWLRTFLAARATAAWEALPIEERARWYEIGAARFAR
jgi:hypothetical protein